MGLTFVVRIGALRRFNRLKDAAAELPVKVIWDRRRVEQRRTSSSSPAERRGIERRRQPSFTWAAADFILVEDSEPLPDSD